MSNFEQQRDKLRAARLAEISGNGPSTTDKPEDVDALIAQDEAKRAAFRVEHDARQQQRLNQLHGKDLPCPPETTPDQVSTPSTPPPPPRSGGTSTTTPTSKSQAKRLAVQVPQVLPAPPSVPSVSGISNTSSSPQSSASTVGASTSTPVVPSPPSVLQASRSSVTSDLPAVDSTTPTLTATPARMGAQIKTDIGRIATQTNNSSLRGLITSYLRVVSPYFIEDRDSAFPRGLHAHANFANRCSSASFGDVLLFHIGSAILGYYACERGDYKQTDLDAIRFLHEVAVIGAGSHRVKGGDARGFMLFATANHDRLAEA